MLKAVLVFCQKSAKIMLIFLKSARGLHKNAHFFPIFLDIEYYIFQIFSYIFQQQNGRVRSRAISALAGWLPLLLDDNANDATLERVWTGFLEGNRWPIKPIPQASSAPLTEMRAKCRFKVRLCFLTQNHTNNQLKIQNNAISAFWDQM